MPTLPTNGPHVSLSYGTAIDRAQRLRQGRRTRTFGVRPGLARSDQLRISIFEGVPEARSRARIHNPVKAGGRAQAGQSPPQKVVDVASRQFRLVQREQVSGAFEHDESCVGQQPGEQTCVRKRGDRVVVAVQHEHRFANLAQPGNGGPPGDRIELAGVSEEGRRSLEPRGHPAVQPVVAPRGAAIDQGADPLRVPG